MRRTTRQERRQLRDAALNGGRRHLVLVLVGVAIASTLVVAWIATSSMRSEPAVAEVQRASGTSESGSASRAATGAIETPSLEGVGLDEARVLLETAGLAVDVRVVGAPVESAEDQVVEGQEPPPGTLLRAGEVVSVVVGPIKVGSSVAAAHADPDAGTWVVCIDPGHQAHADDSPEPIGPGSKETKAAISAGTSGVKTGLAEYEVALQISMNLKRTLEERGIKVVMTRTTNDVSLTNRERAEVATKAGAHLFVRIHGDGSPDSDVGGISTSYPASNKWTRRFAAPSKRAAQSVQTAVVAATGAQDRGTVARDDVAGFNWAKVPCVLIETGFMSNPIEDRLLASPHYQDKLAEGIANGIAAFLAAEEDR